MAAASTIISTGLSAAGSGMSFLNASKQKTAQKKAETAAAEAMASAKTELSKNFYSGLDINLSSYEQERDSLAGVGQSFLQAGQAGERGAGAMAGRVLGAVQEGEKDITNRQIGAIETLEQSVAKEESRLAGLRSDLNLAEAEGAQQAAADAAKEHGSNTPDAVGGVLEVVAVIALFFV